MPVLRDRRTAAGDQRPAAGAPTTGRLSRRRPAASPPVSDFIAECWNKLRTHSPATVGVFVPPAELDAALIRHGQLDRVAAYAAPASTTQAASSGGISTTTGVILAVVVAMLAIAAWRLPRQRSRPRSATSRSNAFCSLHPEDARCTAG